MGAVRLAAGVDEEPFLPLAVLGNPVVRCAALAGACCMGTLVGMTIFVPLYFEVVLHLSAGQSGMALIPLMGATVMFSTITGRLMMHVTHYKRMPLDRPLARDPGAGGAGDLAGLDADAAVLTSCSSSAPASAACSRSRPCACRMPSRSHIGVATGAANFFRALFSALIVAVLGAIVLGGLGGGAGMSVEMLARAASGPSCLRLPFRVLGRRAGLRPGLYHRHGGAAAERPGPDRAGGAAPRARRPRSRARRS